MSLIDPNIILQKYPWYVPAHIALWQQEGTGSQITQIIAMNYSEALVEEESVDVGLFQGYADDEPAAAAVAPQPAPQSPQPAPQSPPEESFDPEPYKNVPLDDVITGMMGEMTQGADDIVGKYLTAKAAQKQAQQEPSAQPAPSAQPPQQQRVRPLTAMQMLENAAKEGAESKRREARASDQIIDKFLEVKELKILATLDDGTDEDLGWQRLDMEPVFAPEDGLVNEELAKIYLNQNHYDQAKDIYNKLFLHYSEKSVYFASQIDAIELLKLENQGPNQGRNKGAN